MLSQQIDGRQWNSTTFSDADGSYMGMDGKVHSGAGRTKYADFSGWDIYRSEAQLLATIAPIEAAASPLPSDETTPPVTRMYFTGR